MTWDVWVGLAIGCFVVRSSLVAALSIYWASLVNRYLSRQIAAAVYSGQVASFCNDLNRFYHDAPRSLLLATLDPTCWTLRRFVRDREAWQIVTSGGRNTAVGGAA